MINKYAQAAADEMIRLLSPAFNRLESVGSLRRHKPEVDELDLLGIPYLAPVPRPRAEFGKPIPKLFESWIDKIIDELSSRGAISISANGPRQKKFYSLELNIRVDLYIVRPPATWGVLQTIRTGPRDFATWIVTQRSKGAGGALPDGYRVEGGGVYQGEEKTGVNDGSSPIGFETERDFLEFLGLGWIEPERRESRWGKYRR